MQNKNIILLDEFDYYKAHKDDNSGDFIKTASLKPIQMGSDEGRTIVKNSLMGNQPISGTILTASQINPNKYYDIHSEELIESLSNDFFEILLKYAPMFGASKIKINYITHINVNKHQSHTIKADVNCNVEYEGTDANGGFSSQSDQNVSKFTSSKITLFKEQETNSSLKKSNKQEIIKCLEEDGIDYKTNPLIDRMLHNFNGHEVIKEIISISKTVQVSDRLLQTLKTSGEVKNILFSAQFNSDYISEINRKLETFQSTSLEIFIQFHEVEEKPKTFLDKLLKK